MRTIYLDNGATSFPKPEGVSRAMKDYMDHVGATINRSVYGSAQDAGLVTLQLRESLAKLFHFTEPATHVILTPGATWGLNMAIKGALKPGDHCIVSSMEHNAVMRPLLQLSGVEYDREFRAYGDFRLVSYTQFLFQHYFSELQRICQGEGVAMRAYAMGEVEAALIEVQAQRTADFADQFFGRKPCVLPNEDILAFEDRARETHLASPLLTKGSFTTAPTPTRQI